MALDEPRSSDEKFDDDGLTFLVDRQLFELARPFRVDYEPGEAGGEFAVSCPLFENKCSLVESPDACCVACAI
jgi:Fe-S cluster assembly iron-binding protein IscA